jgi:hypothetical protein
MNRMQARPVIQTNVPPVIRTEAWLVDGDKID